MANVFLSYDHEDVARAASVAAVLERHGHSVWWDRHIHGGAEYNSEIENAVKDSDAVVVLWSVHSIRSAWVRDEAAEGRDAGKLVPIVIDSVKPPMGFRQFQTIDVVSWNGGKRIPKLPDLLHAIDSVAKVTPVAPPDSRPTPRPKEPVIAPVEAKKNVSRRLLVVGGAATIAAITGGIWWSTREHESPQFHAILEEAEDAIDKETFDTGTARNLERAVAIRPHSARAWGLLALLRSLLAQNADPRDSQRLVEQAGKAAERALAIEPREPNALLAMFELQGPILDWKTRYDRVRWIISIDPNNVAAIGEIVVLTQATGYIRESWMWNEHALALKPLSVDFLGRRALKLWFLGRTGEADKVSDQIRDLYPADAWAWRVRFRLYAFTGRPRAAQAMLDGNPGIGLEPPQARLWRAALPAMDQPSPANKATARAACVEGAQMSGQLANESVLIMSVLGDVGTAFAIANGFLLSRGPIVRRERPGSLEAAHDAGWRSMTQWMFSPPAGPMRRDPRFLRLCEGVGLTDYWRKRGIKPDYQRA